MEGYPTVGTDDAYIVPMHIHIVIQTHIHTPMKATSLCWDDRRRTDKIQWATGLWTTVLVMTPHCGPWWISLAGLAAVFLLLLLLRRSLMLFVLVTHWPFSRT